MNRKVLLAIAIGIVLAIVVIVVSVFTILGGKDNGKKIEKEFASSILDEEKFEDYLRKNIEIKYSYAFENCDLIGTDTSVDEIREEFEELAKEPSKEELEEYREDKITEIVSMFDLETISEMKLIDKGKKETYGPCAMFDYSIAKYNVTRHLSESGKTDTEEIKVAFMYYKDKLIDVLPEEYFYLGIDDEEILEEDFEEENDLDISETVLDTLTLSDAEIKEFNALFEKYNDEVIKGSSLKELIDLVITTNEKYVGDNERFVSIETEDIAEYEGIDLYTPCTEANPGYGGKNSEERVKKASDAMRKVKDIIEDDENYEVLVEYKREIVANLYITQE